MKLGQPQAGQVYYWANVNLYRVAHQRPNLTMSIQWAENEPEPLCLISNLSLSGPSPIFYTRCGIGLKLCLVIASHVVFALGAMSDGYAGSY